MSQLRKTSNTIVRRSALTATIALALAGSAHAGYINDGSFESPVQGYSYLAGGAYTFAPTVAGVAFSGESTSGIAAQGTFLSASSVPDGSQYGFIRNNGGPTNGFITFDVTGLTAGTTYNVSFFAAMASGYVVDPLQVFFNSLSLGTFTPGSTAAFTAFTSGNFTATGTTGSLEFLGLATTGPFALTDLDNVVINAVVGATPAPTSGVPEPTPIALLGLGLIGGVLARRRSKAALRA